MQPDIRILFFSSFSPFSSPSHAVPLLRTLPLKIKSKTVTSNRLPQRSSSGGLVSPGVCSLFPVDSLSFSFSIRVGHSAPPLFLPSAQVNYPGFASVKYREEGCALFFPILLSLLPHTPFFVFSLLPLSRIDPCQPPSPFFPPNPAFPEKCHAAADTDV